MFPTVFNVSGKIRIPRPIVHCVVQRCKWLEEALAAMAGNNPIKKMIECIQTLVDGERPMEEQEQALDDLQDYCEDIDLANGSLFTH